MFYLILSTFLYQNLINLNNIREFNSSLKIAGLQNTTLSSHSSADLKLNPLAKEFTFICDKTSPTFILQSIRSKNLDRVIFSHLNINSIWNKLETLYDIVKNKIDILLVSEIKIDNTFPVNQFILNGFFMPFRLDRTANGGGLLLYVRHDIPCKLIDLETEIECIVTEETVGKKKWLVLGTYNASKTLIGKHLLTLE